MPVRLLRPYLSQAINTLFWGSEDAYDTLRATGGADDNIDRASDYAPLTRIVTSAAANTSRNATTYKMNSLAPQVLTLNTSGYWPTGGAITVAALGAGSVTVTPASGVTINGDVQPVTIAAQNSEGRLLKTGQDTWVTLDGFTGQIAAANAAAGGDPLARASSRNGRATLAVIGDSRVAQGIQIIAQNGGINKKKKPTSFAAWWEFLSRGRISAPSDYNFGVSGSLITALAAQVQQVLALNPRPTHCLILSGTNSFAANVTAADGWAQYAPNIQALVAAGIRPICLADLPRAIGSWTASAAAQSIQFNQLLFRNAPALGALVVDPAYLLADPANTAGDPLTGYYQNNGVTDNGIHPATLADFLIGQAVDGVVSPLIQGPLPFVSSRADVYDATNNPFGNILESVMSGSSLMQGTAGTNTTNGGTASGTVASGWNNRTLTGTGTSVASIEARADGKPGNNQVLTLSSASGVSTYRFSFITNPLAASYYVAGDKLQLAIDMSVSAATGLEGLYFYVQDFDGTNPRGAGQWGDNAIIGSNYYPYPTAFSGRAFTDPAIIVASPLSLIIRMEMRVNNGGATIKIGGAELRRV